MKFGFGVSPTVSNITTQTAAILSGGGGSPVVSPAPFSDNVVRHYNFSDDANLVLSGSTIVSANDLSGNGVSATGSGVVRTASQINGLQAAVFDVGDYFTFSDTSLPVTDASRTLAMVVRPTRNDSGGMGIFGYGTFTGNQQFTIAIKDTTGYWFSWGFSHDNVSSTAYTANTNYRVILTYDSATNAITMKVNGTNIISTTTTDYNTVLNTGVIGNPVNVDWVGGYDFGGAIGETIIYDRSLSTAEQTTLDSYLSTGWSF